MSSYGQDILLEQLPLMLGLALFVLLMKFNPYSRHFVIQHNIAPTAKSQIAKDAEKGARAGNYLSDQLIINGIRAGRGDSDNLRSRAFHSLGLVETPLAGSYLLKCRDRPDRISLLSSNPAHLTNLLTEKSSLSGLLLAYLLDSKLEEIVV
ncbi:MAG: hypothetical protein KGH65_04660 [Candidatus Micrarchaeota archaeon]|nr:hypothetical protein [Candidatus Micrarchaeota archaeon]